MDAEKQQEKEEVKNARMIAEDFWKDYGIRDVSTYDMVLDAIEFTLKQMVKKDEEIIFTAEPSSLKELRRPRARRTQRI